MGNKRDEAIPAFRGTPQEVGEKFALLNKAPLLRRFNGWLEECTAGGCSREELIRKSEKYTAAAE